MTKALLIAEKASLKNSIQEAYRNHKDEIGIDIDFLAQSGHLLRLKSPSEIAPEYKNWNLNLCPIIYPYELTFSGTTPDAIKSSKSKIKTIKDAIATGKYDFIIHAGDPDQEGELLINETLKFIGNKLPVKRFWSNDTTEKSCVEALKNLKDDSFYSGFNDAALVRSHADYQYGMNTTIAISLKYGETCKTGRVKAIIISLLAQKEIEIQNYVEKKTYKPAFKYKNISFISDEAFDTPEEAKAENFPSSFAVVTKTKIEKKGKKPPKYFKLSTLQTEAHKAFGWDGKKTLEVLQTLYESKYTTYPRTDCEYISSLTDIKYIKNQLCKMLTIDEKLLVKSASDILSDKNFVNDKEITSHGHTAILPTGEIPSSLSPDQEKLFILICTRFLASFGADKITEIQKVEAIPDGRTRIYEFTETYDIAPGYEYILNPNYKFQNSCGIVFAKDDKLMPIEFYEKECISKPPVRYNDGSIIAVLDNPPVKVEDDNGKKVKYTIGTPATRAKILEETMQNGYFTKKKGVYYATDKAVNLYKCFNSTPLFQIERTGFWETLFIKLRNKEEDIFTAEKDLLKELSVSIEDIKNIDCSEYSSSSKKVLGLCPKCQGEILTGKFGAYCSNKCGMILSKAYGKELSESEICSLLRGERTHIKGFISNKTKKPYDANLTPLSVEPFSYTDKNGNTQTGYSWKFKMDFDKS